MQVPLQRTQRPGEISMTAIRSAELDDLDELYAISLATGHLGADASHLYGDPKMIGHIYSAPYLKLASNLSFVVEDTVGVAGFIAGAIDTVSFERRLEDEWWPDLRAVYVEPNQDTRANWSADQRRSFMIHHPQQTPETLVNAFPSHLHMNLLPRIQGRGIGPELLELWLEKARELGAAGVHVGSNSKNQRAIKFWKRCGFEDLDSLIDLPPSRSTWLGRIA